MNSLLFLLNLQSSLVSYFRFSEASDCDVWLRRPVALQPGERRQGGQGEARPLVQGRRGEAHLYSGRPR